MTHREAIVQALAETRRVPDLSGPIERRLLANQEVILTVLLDLAWHGGMLDAEQGFSRTRPIGSGMVKGER